MVHKILFGGRGADLYIHNIDEQKKQKLLEEKTFAPYSPISLRYAKNMKIKIGDKFLDGRQVAHRTFKILTDDSSSHNYLKNWVKENFDSGKTYGCDLIVKLTEYSALLLNCYPDELSDSYLIIRFDSYRNITKAEKRDERLEDILTEISK